MEAKNIEQIWMREVVEYNEEDPVYFAEAYHKWDNDICEDIIIERPVIIAINEGGHNSVQIDLLQLIEWLKENKPELL